MNPPIAAKEPFWTALVESPWLPRAVVRNGDLTQKGDIQLHVLESWLRANGEHWWIA